LLRAPDKALLHAGRDETAAAAEPTTHLSSAAHSMRLLCCIPLIMYGAWLNNMAMQILLFSVTLSKF
jgi:hypothetical protein